MAITKLESTTYPDFPEEKNDCTVRAYAKAAEISYAQAHEEISAAGRKFGKGFRVHNFYTEQKQFLWYPRPRRTVENFILNVARKGNWIIWIRGHVFAVCDGVIFDRYPKYNLKRHVLGAWQVSLVTQKEKQDAIL